MHAPSILSAALSVFAIGAQASSCYRECECWNKVTSSRDAAVGEKACNQFVKTYERTVEWNKDRNVCREVGSAHINNGKWDKMCREQGSDSHFQKCYDKASANGC